MFNVKFPAHFRNAKLNARIYGLYFFSFSLTLFEIGWHVYRNRQANTNILTMAIFITLDYA
jgi:hypothetical protein